MSMSMVYVLISIFAPICFVICIGCYIWSISICKQTRRQIGDDEELNRRMDISEIVLYGAIMTQRGK